MFDFVEEVVLVYDVVVCVICGDVVVMNFGKDVLILVFV